MGFYKVRPVAVGMLPRGKNYSVKDLGDSAQGYIKMLEQEIGVSRNADLPWTRFTQGHEMTHVEHSKCLPELMAKKAGIDIKAHYHWHDWVNAGEDARVNSKLRRAIPNIHEGFSYPDDMPLRDDLSGYMASWGMPDEIRMRVRKALEIAGLGAQADRIDAACRRLTRKGNFSISKFAVPLIRLMAELCKAPSQTLEPPPPGEGNEQEQDKQGQEEQEQEGQGKDEQSEQDGEGGLGQDHKPGEPSKAEQEQDAKDEEEMGADDKHDPEPWQDKPMLGGPPQTDPNGEARWLIPEVLTPRLTVTVQRPGTHSSIACDSGVYLRDVTRISCDGQIFGRSRMRPGTIRRGVFLVDGSGSMNLEMAHVEQIINAVPAATIAIYSGRHMSDTARLIVIAKDGKRCEADEVSMLGDNMCDGPALLWLARQAGPRFWYSDGRVTNYRASAVPALREEVAAICQAAKIHHINPEKAPGYVPYSSDLDHGAYIVQSLKNLKMIR